MIRILTFGGLYPHVVDPMLGVFVENRLIELVKSGEVTARVVAPIPWAPSWLGGTGYYTQLRRVPRHDDRNGIAIEHPRYFRPTAPRAGMFIAALTMFLAGKACIGDLLRQGADFDLIDAHLLYPDGVAAILLGRAFNKPVTITARGPDLHESAERAIARRLIVWSARHAAALIATGEGNKERFVALGIDGHRITLLRNGVDLATFCPTDRVAARGRLGVTGLALLSVGRLVPLKGHHLVIEALVELPEAIYLLVGEGPEQGRLRALAERLGVAGRVRFLGKLPHHSLAEVYGAADVLIHPSSHEGLPNAPLEAIACGTPVVATDIPGPREIVTHGSAGVLMRERTAGAVVVAVRQLLADPPDRAATRAFAERFGWGPTIGAQIELFRRVIREAKAAA